MPKAASIRARVVAQGRAGRDAADARAGARSTAWPIRIRRRSRSTAPRATSATLMRRYKGDLVLVAAAYNAGDRRGASVTAACRRTPRPRTTSKRSRPCTSVIAPRCASPSARADTHRSPAAGYAPAVAPAGAVRMHSRSYETREPERSEVDARRRPGRARVRRAVVRALHRGAASDRSRVRRPSRCPSSEDRGRQRQPLGRSFRVKLWPTLVFLRDGEEVARLVRPVTMRADRRCAGRNRSRSRAHDRRPAPPPCIRARRRRASRALAGHRRSRGCRPAAHRCRRGADRREPRRRRACSVAAWTCCAASNCIAGRTRPSASAMQARVRRSAQRRDAVVARHPLSCARTAESLSTMARFTAVRDFTGVLRAIDHHVARTRRRTRPSVEPPTALGRTAAHALEALRVSDDRYRALFESIDQGFCVIEVMFEGERAVDYRFLEVNPAFERYTGLTDVVGKRDARTRAGPRIALVSLLRRCRAHRAAGAHACCPRRRWRRWYEVHAFPFGPARSHRVAVLFDDISPGVRTELALRDSEERFRCLANATPSILWSATVRWRDDLAQRSLDRLHRAAGGCQPRRAQSA